MSEKKYVFTKPVVYDRKPQPLGKTLTPKKGDKDAKFLISRGILADVESDEGKAAIAAAKAAKATDKK